MARSSSVPDIGRTWPAETPVASLSVRPATHSSREPGPPTSLALHGAANVDGARQRRRAPSASYPAGGAPRRARRCGLRRPAVLGDRRQRARRPQLHALALALQRRGRARVEAAVVEAQQPLRRVGHEHRVAGLARHLLDARGRVDRVADDGELDVPAAADRARDDEPGVDADPDAQAARGSAPARRRRSRSPPRPRGRRARRSARARRRRRAARRRRTCPGSRRGARAAARRARRTR